MYNDFRGFINHLENPAILCKENGEILEFNSQIKNILKFTSNMALNYDINFLDMKFGGREKDIISRKTDWCADMQE